MVSRGLAWPEWSRNFVFAMTERVEVYSTLIGDMKVADGSLLNDDNPLDCDARENAHHMCEPLPL